jgi:hypothetical protein
VVRDRLGKITPQWDDSSAVDIIYPVARNVAGSGSNDYRQILRTIRVLTEYPGLPIDKATRDELISASRSFNDMPTSQLPDIIYNRQIDKKVRKIFDTSQNPELSLVLLKQYKLYDPLTRAEYNLEAMSRGDYYNGLRGVYGKNRNWKEKLPTILQLQQKYGGDARQIPQKEIDSNNLFVDRQKN